MLSLHRTARSLNLLPIGCLIVVGKLNDGVGVVLCYAFMGEQVVQEGTKHAPTRVPRVEDQRGRLQALL